MVLLKNIRHLMRSWNESMALEIRMTSPKGEGTESWSAAELLDHTLLDVYCIEITATEFEFITPDEKFQPCSSPRVLKR